MRLSAVLGIGLLALASARAQEADPVRVLTAVRIEGGDSEDQRFAQAALGLKPGQPVDGRAFQLALAAVRLVDRYRLVEGSLEANGSALVKLEPFLPLVTWRWEGDAIPKLLKKSLLPELRGGQRLGPQRRAVLVRTAEQRLKEAGYPEAKIEAILEQGGRHLRMVLTLGPATMIREIRLEGDHAPYTRANLLKAAGLGAVPMIWTPGLAREAQRRLRQWLVEANRLEGSVRLEPANEPGVMILEVRTGPIVTLDAKGMNSMATWIGRPRLSEFVPLARAERYSPSLLEEGAGRITTYYRNQGYPEVKVTYNRVVKAGTEERPEVVRITYTVEFGPLRTLGEVRFEGNRELSDEELRPAVTLPKRWLVMAPQAKAETVKALEERLTAFYLQRGFPDVRVRRRVETAKDGTVEVRLVIREGQQRFLDALLLELPADPGFSRRSLSQSLLLTLSDHPSPGNGTTSYHSDRRHLLGYKGTLENTATGVRLSFQPSLPLVRNDLALVVSDLRRRLASAGAGNPEVKLAFEEDGDQSLVRIQVPSQPLDHPRRLIVQGSDRTKAEAVLREAELPQAAPLDPAKLDEGQIQLGGLGAFQRVDLLTAKDLPGQEQQPWERGDLVLRLEERSPWVFTEAFGYDSTQGYRFGLNAQRLNVGGMGRIVDFGIRAGNQTLDSPALRKAFPTGDTPRSLDTYGIGYTDPWFLPGSLDSWLASRTRFRVDAIYIEEAQAAYLAHRRRFTSSLEWKITPTQAVQVGYRFERVEVAANTASSNKLSDAELFLVAKTPPHSVISAPYIQVAVDRRDRPYDPTDGTFFLGRLEFAAQFFGTSPNSSFIKLDLRQQWNWHMGFNAEDGVLMANVRVGAARPTARTAEDLPLSERFFGGGPSTVRGVEPDMLGRLGLVNYVDQPGLQFIPLGGQALAVVNLEYRFPLFGQSVWAEVFVDSGQVYRSLNPSTEPVDPNKPPLLIDQPQFQPQCPFPPFRTTLGLGLIFKLGFPLKLEYAADLKRIMGRPRTVSEQETQLKSLLISAGFQF